VIRDRGEAILTGRGLAPEDIDIVLCTHLQRDHVGWNTRLIGGRWVASFPNARYVMNRAEYDRCVARHTAEANGAANHGALKGGALPDVNAGPANCADAAASAVRNVGETIFPPSPGHVRVHAEAGACEAIVAGDLVHHPNQIDGPNMHIRATRARPCTPRTVATR
jgi:hypothetical protein